MFHFIFSQINEKFSRSFDDSGLIKTIVLLNDPFQMDLRGNNSKKHNYTATLKSKQHKILMSYENDEWKNVHTFSSLHVLKNTW